MNLKQVSFIDAVAKYLNGGIIIFGDQCFCNFEYDKCNICPKHKYLCSEFKIENFSSDNIVNDKWYIVDEIIKTADLKQAMLHYVNGGLIKSNVSNKIYYSPGFECDDCNLSFTDCDGCEILDMDRLNEKVLNGTWTLY